jgi:large exoprotein involved in heme utilization and adhesion
LTATGGASIDSSIAGTGTTVGDIKVDATGAISFSGVGTNGNPTGISSEVKQTGSGQGGNILLTGASLTVDDGAKLSASTGGQGNGGGINITAPNSVTLSSNGQISAETSGSGRAGKVAINTPTLNVNGGAKVSTTTTSTVNTGTGGNLTVSANTLNLSGAKSGLLAETKGAANAGSLTLNPYSGGNDLQVNFAQDAQISASTSGSGTGGNIIVSAPNSVTLKGDGSEKGGLSASASNTGDGGRIDIKARRLEMDRATIRSEAESSEAGDISLTLNDLLLLRHNSLISTTAGSAQAPGNGGNITISAPFVVAVPSENNDIIANAFSGNGGQINIIDNYRVFGLKPQNRQSFNTLRQNRTSDISASSQSGIQGNINIQSLSIDPSQGLTNLPVDVIDPSRQIVNGCGASSGTADNAQGEFVVTGRGGLPPSPDDMQSSGAIPPSWVTRDGGNISRSSAPVELPASPSTPPLVEAQGMFINAKGEVVLTAQTPTTTPHQPGIAEPVCSPARR